MNTESTLVGFPPAPLPLVTGNTLTTGLFTTEVVGLPCAGKGHPMRAYRSQQAAEAAALELSARAVAVRVRRAPPPVAGGPGRTRCGDHEDGRTHEAAWADEGELIAVYVRGERIFPGTR